MVNNTQNSKLDETVKQTLSNYEAKFDVGDWAKMESILDAAPKSSSFKWSYTLNIFIGAAVLTGGYFIYKLVNTIKTSEKLEVTAPIIENKIATGNTKPEIKPLTTPSIIQPPQTNTALTSATELSAKKNNVAIVTNDKKTIPSENNNIDPSLSKNLISDKTKTKKSDKTKVNKEVEDEFNKTQQVIGMGNEPIFGDMLDSSKGIIAETREKEETKKAAKSKTEYPVGWNTFMLSNVNLDSIKNYRAKNAKDSLKKE